jgi:hypothetical protein
MFIGATSVMAEPWKFGVMSDTQWKANADGQNPETVAVGIINQLNTQFINHGVKFVIQVGDLVDKETDSPNGFPSNRTMDTRAAAAQALYDAGIGFYPLRGNHEGSSTAAVEFQTLYPQTQSTTSSHSLADATNFRSPSTMPGLSYAFDYKGATFVLLDQFNRPDGTSQSVLGQDQVNWVSSVLSSKPADNNAFVFAHKGLITENHTDILFGSNPAVVPDLQNQFMSILADNGVHYYFGGHDHMHNRAIVTSPSGTSTVQDITTSSNSYKFYIPQNPSNDSTYNNPTRETEIAQELFTIGYYIMTVDGPRVTVDFYSSPNGCNGDCDLITTPTLTFTKRETFGYSLNGKEFLVAQGQSYTTVQDSFEGTTAQILGGMNGSTATVYDGRATTKTVDTGWTPRTAGTRKKDDDTASNILTLWGMASSLGNETVVVNGQSQSLRADQTTRSDQTDVYTLSMSYDHHRLLPIQLGQGLLGLATRDENGDWVNAVDKNFGGAKKFVLGPWKSGYGLGTYGLDLITHTAWAVINYNADFAVAGFKHFDKNGWQ